jgi:hypothetical protein
MALQRTPNCHGSNLKPSIKNHPKPHKAKNQEEIESTFVTMESHRSTVNHSTTTRAHPYHLGLGWRSSALEKHRRLPGQGKRIKTEDGPGRVWFWRICNPLFPWLRVFLDGDGNLETVGGGSFLSWLQSRGRQGRRWRGDGWGREEGEEATRVCGTRWREIETFTILFSIGPGLVYDPTIGLTHIRI